MQKPDKYLRTAFFVFVRVFILALLGLNVRRKHLLPAQGPAIVVANHNSHLDTLVLISLFSLRMLPKIRPVAAADHFLRNRFMAWFSTRIIGIISVDRNAADKSRDPLQACYEALDREEILVLFPEGTRGEPEKLSPFKKGISWIAERYPQVPVIPVFMHGLGKAFPKDDFLFVPFFCDVFVGDSVPYQGNKDTFMILLSGRFQALADEGHFPTE